MTKQPRKQSITWYLALQIRPIRMAIKWYWRMMRKQLCLQMHRKYVMQQQAARAWKMQSKMSMTPRPWAAPLMVIMMKVTPWMKRSAMRQINWKTAKWQMKWSPQMQDIMSSRWKQPMIRMQLQAKKNGSSTKERAANSAKSTMHGKVQQTTHRMMLC